MINLSANGTHATFTRNVAAITMDLESVERIEFKALGGADAITIGDLSGTGIKQVALDLGAKCGVVSCSWVIGRIIFEAPSPPSVFRAEIIEELFYNLALELHALTIVDQ